MYTFTKKKKGTFIQEIVPYVNEFLNENVWNIQTSTLTFKSFLIFFYFLFICVWLFMLWHEPLYYSSSCMFRFVTKKINLLRVSNLFGNWKVFAVLSWFQLTQTLSTLPTFCPCKSNAQHDAATTAFHYIFVLQDCLLTNYKTGFLKALLQ